MASGAHEAYSGRTYSSSRFRIKAKSLSDTVFSRVKASNGKKGSVTSQEQKKDDGEPDKI